MFLFNLTAVRRSRSVFCLGDNTTADTLCFGLNIVQYVHESLLCIVYLVHLNLNNLAICKKNLKGTFQR